MREAAHCEMEGRVAVRRLTEADCGGRTPEGMRCKTLRQACDWDGAVTCDTRCVHLKACCKAGVNTYAVAASAATAAGPPA